MAHKGEKSNGSHYDSSGATKNVYSKKKRTSFVNENDWWSKLAQGFEYLKRGGSYEPHKIVRSMEKREGLSKQKTDTKGIKPSDLSYDHSVEGHMSRLKDGGKLTGRAAYLPGIRGQLKAESYMKFKNKGHFADAMQDPWNARKKQKSDNASRY